MASGRLGLVAALALSACVSSDVGLLEQAARDHSEQGRAAFSVADHTSAIALYSKSLRHHQETANHLESCLDLLNLAVVYRAMERPRAAAECMSAFTAISTKLDGQLLPKDERRRLRSLQAEADWFQAVLALDRGQREKARAFLEKSRSYNLPQLRERIRLLDARIRGNSRG